MVLLTSAQISHRKSVTISWHRSWLPGISTICQGHSTWLEFKTVTCKINLQHKFKKYYYFYPNRTPVVTKYNFKLDQIKTWNDIKTMNFCLNMKFWIQTFFISSKNWWILVRIVLIMFRLNSDKFQNSQFQASMFIFEVKSKEL